LHINVESGTEHTHWRIGPHTRGRIKASPCQWPLSMPIFVLFICHTVEGHRRCRFMGRLTSSTGYAVKSHGHQRLRLEFDCVDSASSSSHGLWPPDSHATASRLHHDVWHMAANRQSFGGQGSCRPRSQAVQSISLRRHTNTTELVYGSPSARLVRRSRNLEKKETARAQ
jgi:hypothetical protein